MADLVAWGRMAAYINAGATFEEFVKEQTELDLGAEARQRWDSLVEWKNNNAGMALDIPYD